MRISREQKINMYRSMIKIRKFEDKLEQIYRDGKLNGHSHTCHGEEAVAVGAIEALFRKRYYLFESSRTWSLFSPGTSPKNIMAECYGKVTGTNKGRSGSMYLVDTKRNAGGKWNCWR